MRARSTSIAAVVWIAAVASPPWLSAEAKTHGGINGATVPVGEMAPTESVSSSPGEPCTVVDREEQPRHSAYLEKLRDSSAELIAVGQAAVSSDQRNSKSTVVFISPILRGGSLQLQGVRLQI
jgi:hypothetical protein